MPCWWQQELSKRLQYVICIVFVGRDFLYSQISQKKIAKSSQN